MSNEALSDQHSPQPTGPAGLRRAGLVRILASMLYDFLPIAGFWLLTSLILVFASGTAVTGAPYQTLLFLELFGYFAFSWVKRGQTLGMVAWKLRLEPTPFSYTQAALRLLGAILGLLAFGLGYFWILIDRNQRSWADILSGSRIDYDPQLGGSWWSGS